MDDSKEIATDITLIDDPAILREQIAELERQEQELREQIAKLQSRLIDWHSAMYAALKLILRPHRFNLTMEREHLLNLMPARIDCLVVKLDAKIPIEMDVFRLFRKHNVIELKSYQDELNEDVLWYVIGQAISYKSQEEQPDEIRIDELTVTIFRSSFPRELFKKLKARGWSIEEKYHNIFYLTGHVSISVQIVIARDLGPEYLPLQILTGRAKETDVRSFAEFRETLTEKGDRDDANAVMYACAEANRELFRKIWEDQTMQGVLREIMKDEFLAVAKENRESGEASGAANAYHTVAERLIRNGTDGNLISVATGYDRNRINSIAKELKIPVTWNEARV